MSAAAWLATISRHWNLVFAASGALMALNYWLVIVRHGAALPETCATWTVHDAIQPPAVQDVGGVESLLVVDAVKAR